MNINYKLVCNIKNYSAQYSRGYAAFKKLVYSDSGWNIELGVELKWVVCDEISFYIKDCKHHFYWKPWTYF